MDTGPTGDPGLTADWTPTGVDLAWDDAVWSATVQVGHTQQSGVDIYGWDAGSDIPGDSLSDMHFDHAGQTYEVDGVAILVESGGTALALNFDSSQHGDIANRATRNNLDLHVGDRVFNLGAATYDNAGKTVQWDNIGLTWANGDTVQLKITRADSPVYNPPTGSEWQFTVWRRNLSDGQSAPYQRVAGSIGVQATTDSTPAVDGKGDLNLVEYVVEGVAYAGGAKVDLWASPKRLFRPHAVLDKSVNTDTASHSGVVAPGHPTGLTADLDVSSNIDLRWEKPAQGPVTGYKVCRNRITNAADGPKDGCEDTFDVSGGDTLTYHDRPNVVTLYEYRVIAANARGGLTAEGGSSNAVRVNKRVTLSEPSSSTFTRLPEVRNADGDYSVTLNWGGSSGANAYLIRRWLYSETHGAIRGYDEQGRPQSGSQKLYTVSGGTTTTFTDREDLGGGQALPVPGVR